jgi:hypothetical protein
MKENGGKVKNMVMERSLGGMGVHLVGSLTKGSQLAPPNMLKYAFYASTVRISMRRRDGK